MNIPEDLCYSKEHEWVRVEGDTAVIGISDFAQGELGDIVFVEVETQGETMEKDGVFGSIEAVKTVSDLFMPVGGEIIAFNEELESDPEKINSDPYGEGWIIKVRMDDPSALDELMDASAYGELVG